MLNFYTVLARTWIQSTHDLCQVELRQLYFSGRLLVGNVKHLSARRYSCDGRSLDESLKRPLKPNGSTIEVVQEGKTKKIVDNAIREVKVKHNACSQPTKWRRSEIDDIGMVSLSSF